MPGCLRMSGVQPVASCEWKESEAEALGCDSDSKELYT